MILPSYVFSEEIKIQPPFFLRSLPDSQKFTFCNGVVLHRNQVKSTLGDWMHGIMELSKSLQQMDIDASAYACLSALTLVNGELASFEVVIEFLHDLPLCQHVRHSPLKAH